MYWTTSLKRKRYGKVFNHDLMLQPPEPQAVRDETREVACTNDDCKMFEEFVDEKVEVYYWSDHEARYTWVCDYCMMENEEEFDPNDEIDWDSIADDMRY